MSGMGLFYALILVLTVVGSGTLLFITVKYYWGERGTPPLSGAARKLQREQEMKLWTKQIEFARAHPRKLRKPDFWDNSKT